MASRHPPGTTRRLGQLWQVPLLLLSLGLFGTAAYLVIDPKAGPTIEQRIVRAEATLKSDRPDAALEQLHDLESRKLTPPDAARVHLLQAQAIDAAQKATKQESPARAAEVIEHSKAALAGGIKPDAATYRRMAESYEVVGRPKDALGLYRKAIDLDPDAAPALRRKVIDLQLARGDAAVARDGLAEYLKDSRLSDAERVWAVGEQSRILVDEGAFDEARKILRAAIQSNDQATQGQVNYRLAYCEWKLGNAAEAERLLRIARDQLTTRHPLDADAALLLGRLIENKTPAVPREAASFFEAVMTAHPDSPLVPLARLGRGVCRIEAGEDAPGLVDLNTVVTEIDARPSRAPLKPEAVNGLRQAAATLADRGNYRGAVELLDLGLKLDPTPPAEFYAQAGSACEKLADEIEKAAAAAPTEAERTKRRGDARTWLVRAGHAAMNYSERLTVSDDKGHAAALWRAVDLYDRAGDLARATAALETYADQRPEDPQTPDALLRLGRMYQVAGNFDKAIAAFKKNQKDHRQAVAASRSGVPLAQAYMAKGPAYYGLAEAALRSMLDSPLVTPDAEDFKSALFELAQLYYRNGRYEEAVSKLQEMTERYPPDGRTGQILFLMADSYRKSAALLKDGGGAKPPTTAPALAAATPAGATAQLAARAEAAAERRDRLVRAKGLFDRVIEQYRTNAPARDLDKLYLKLAHFYRADCQFDAGGYDEAIRLYDAAALRYQDDPAALTAYVQIVNAYCALGRTEEARAANERAKWLLRKIPPESFKGEAFVMPKEYWENWLKWSGDAAMW